MERSWSEEALEAFDSFPWDDERQKQIAREETKLVAAGDVIETDDLPIYVRNHFKNYRRKTVASPSDVPWTWKGESWKELTENFEKSILTQALEKNNGFVAKAARDLRTTPRIVAYKAAKYKILTKQQIKKAEEKEV